MTDGHIKQVTESFSQVLGILAESKPERRDALSGPIESFGGEVGKKRCLAADVQGCGTDPYMRVYMQHLGELIRLP